MIILIPTLTVIQRTLGYPVELIVGLRDREVLKINIKLKLTGECQKMLGRLSTKLKKSTKRPVKASFTTSSKT